MDKQTLLKTANRLKQPGNSLAAEFSAKREEMTARCSQTIAGREDLDRLIGPGNLEMALDNNRNFSRFMESLFYDFEPEVFVETVLWVFTAYRSHGFSTTYWPANLNIWVDALKASLSGPALDEVQPFYNWLIINIPVFVKLTDTAVPDGNGTDSHRPDHGAGSSRP